MSWVKRNLYFLVGGAVAVALLGVAGFYLYSKWKLNNDASGKLEAAYADWQRIINLQPGPGNDKVNNIDIAREQTKNVRAAIQNVRKYFTPIAPIPSSRKPTMDEFTTALRVTIAQLQRDATNASVGLQPKYNFSFEAQKNTYNIRGFDQLAPALGDVKAICDVLFRAKPNFLDGIRRERVTLDDTEKGGQSDYLDPTLTSVTNDLAVLVPYEVTFKCFSGELGSVLNGFGNDPHGFILKAINIEPAAGTASTDVTPGATYPGGVTYPGGGGGGYYSYSAAAPAVAAPTPAAGRGGLTTVLEEKPLKVTMTLVVVRLSPRR